MDARTEMQRLESLAKAWGGKFVKVSRDMTYPVEIVSLSGYSSAPFTDSTLGIVFKTKTLYYYPERVDWTEVVHEMGHLFATNKPPDATTEWDWFGWEFCLANKVAGKSGMDALRKQHGDYVVGVHEIRNSSKRTTLSSYELGHLTRLSYELRRLTLDTQWLVIRDAIQRAKDLGIADARGRPRPWSRRLGGQ